MIGQNGRRTLIYIGGYGRSGSTLLDLMLSSSSELLSLGEIVELPLHHLDQGDRCSCGAVYADCSFWSRVFESFCGDDCEKRLRNLHRLSARHEGWGGIVRRFSEGSSRTMHATELCRFYESIYQSLGNRIPVESSKTARSCVMRPYLLQKTCGLRIKLIHITRDPRGVYLSIAKGGNKELESGLIQTVRFRKLRGLSGWALANSAAVLNRLLLGDEQYLHLRYEDLVSSPDSSIRRIEEFLGMDLTAARRMFLEPVKITNAHLAGGNRMARTGEVLIRPDRAWEDLLSASRRFLVWLAVFPLAIFFGYRPLLLRPGRRSFPPPGKKA